MSFQPLVQCLDVDNLIRLFTAVLLERRILLRANKYVSFLLMTIEVVPSYIGVNVGIPSGYNLVP